MDPGEGNVINLHSIENSTHVRSTWEENSLKASYTWKVVIPQQGSQVGEILFYMTGNLLATVIEDCQGTHIQLIISQVSIESTMHLLQIDGPRVVFIIYSPTPPLLHPPSSPSNLLS